jgi:hypothetical protein
MIEIVLTEKGYSDLKNGKEICTCFMQPVLDAHKELLVKRSYFDTAADAVHVEVSVYIKTTHTTTYILKPKAILQQSPFWVRDGIEQGGAK